MKKGIWDIETNFHKFDFLINDKEKCIMKLLVRPIHHYDYLFLLFEKDNSYYIKTVCYHEFELFKLCKEVGIKSNIPKGTNLFDYLDNICPTIPIYITEFKKRYLITDVKYDLEIISSYITEIKKLDFEKHDRPTIFGLDGYSLEAEIFGYKFWMWLYCTEPYYELIVGFINYLLNTVGVEQNYRFSIYEYHENIN